MEGTFCLFRWHACVHLDARLMRVCTHTWFPLAFLSPAVISLWAGLFYALHPGLWALSYFPTQAVVLPLTVCSNQKCESEWRQEAVVVASWWLSCALGKEGRVRPILAALADGDWSLWALACALPPVLSLGDVLLDGHPRLARLRPKSKQQTQLVCIVTFANPDSSLC